MPYIEKLDCKLTSSLSYINASIIMKNQQNTCMKAKFATTCQACGEQIRPGKQITKDNGGRWVHNYCTETEIP